MSESRKTLTWVGVATFLLLTAFLTTPRKATPDAFLDRGEAFFPEFADPNTAQTLEVIDYDEETGTARPFKVTFADGNWTIPSHHNYPADGGDRLAQTAAAVIDITKDDFRSNNVADHEACRVVDPLDETTASLMGRGRRITIKGEADRVLADLIVGDQPEGRENFRFVRVPSQRRVYVARMDIDISTQFQDWIEQDLLQTERDDIRQVTLKDYSINELTQRVNQRDTLILTKTDDTWKANRMTSSQQVDSTKMNDLLQNIDELAIVGVRPKPAGLSQSLGRTEGGIRISQPDVLSLRSKGYYFDRDGRLLSNEGELEVATSRGVVYTLRFGEVVYGSGESVTAGSDSSDDQNAGPGENRYLFITAQFNTDQLPEPPKPRNTKFRDKPQAELTEADRRNKEREEAHAAWQQQIEEGRRVSEELNTRFADWYYVIPSTNFDKIRVGRSDLVTAKS